MTQALAGFNEHGIVLATDSRASRFDAAGRAEYFQVKKLLPSRISSSSMRPKLMA